MYHVWFCFSRPIMKSLGGFFIRRKLDKRNGKKDMVYRSILHIVSLNSWYVHVWKHKQLYVCIQYLVWNSFHYFYSTLRNCSGMDKAWNFFWREVGADQENLCLLKLAFCQLLKKLCAVVRKDYYSIYTSFLTYGIFVQCHVLSYENNCSWRFWVISTCTMYIYNIDWKFWSVL